MWTFTLWVRLLVPTFLLVAILDNLMLAKADSPTQDLCRSIANGTAKMIAAAPLGQFFTIVLSDYSVIQVPVKNYETNLKKAPPRFHLNLVDLKFIPTELIQRNPKMNEKSFKRGESVKAVLFDNSVRTKVAYWSTKSIYLAVFNRKLSKVVFIQLDNQDVDRIRPVNKDLLANIQHNKGIKVLHLFSVARRTKRLGSPQLAAVFKGKESTKIQARSFMLKDETMKKRQEGASLWTAGSFYKECSVGFVHYTDNGDKYGNGYAIGFDQTNKLVTYYVMGGTGRPALKGDSMNIPLSSFFLCTEEDVKQAKENQRNETSHENLILLGVLVLVIAIGGYCYCCMFQDSKKKKQKMDSRQKSRSGRRDRSVFKRKKTTEERSTRSFKSTTSFKGAKAKSIKSNIASSSNDLRVSSKTSSSKRNRSPIQSTKSKSGGTKSHTGSSSGLRISSKASSKRDRSSSK